jgi:hypothetical protein
VEEETRVKGRAEWVTTAVLLVLLLGMYALLLLPDGTISWLLKEERPIDGAGALGLLASSILCLLLWRHDSRAGGPRWRRLSLLGLALVFFVGAGEEISWGQRILGLETPESLESINDQGEINLHNLSTGTLNQLFQVFWLVMGVLVPIAGLHQPTRRLLARFLPILPAPLAIAFVANQVAIRVGDRLFESHPDLYNGTKYDVEYGLFEIKESVVGIVFAAGLWLLYRRVRARSAQRAGG